MSFGERLEKNFQYLAREDKYYYEAELFTKLEDALLMTGGDLEVELIHGSRSMVSFYPKEAWVDGVSPFVARQVELEDMLFTIYSRKKDLMRIFVLQTKGKSETVHKKRSSKADLIQLDMLHNHLLYDGKTSENLLFGSKQETVSVYGYFYKREDKKAHFVMDANFYAASKLEPVTCKGKSKLRMVRYSSSKSAKRGGVEEDACEIIGVRTFGDAIENCAIGRIITREDREIVQGLRLVSEETQHFGDFLDEWCQRRELRRDNVRGNWVDFKKFDDVFLIDIDQLTK